MFCDNTIRLIDYNRYRKDRIQNQTHLTIEGHALDDLNLNFGGNPGHCLTSSTTHAYYQALLNRWVTVCIPIPPVF